MNKTLIQVFCLNDLFYVFQALNLNTDGETKSEEEESSKETNIEKIRQNCKASEPVMDDKYRKIDLITEPASDGIYVWGSASNQVIGSLCSNTNVKRISFLDNSQSSCYIRLSKKNITDCDDLKKNIRKIYVS